MQEAFRRHLIANHKFYVEQAKKRLLSQFSDISGEADKFVGQWLDEHSHLYDPSFHGPGDFEQLAYDESIEFYGLLQQMHGDTRLSVLAGMFHQWDKRVRDWLARELTNRFLVPKAKAAVWDANFVQLFELMDSFGWRMREQEYFGHLDTCRLLVNVYKHGPGTSFDDIKNQHPEYLKSAVGGVLGAERELRYADNTNLKVGDEDVDRFSNAVIAFWECVPTTTLISQITTTPAWFSKALEKDIAIGSRGGK